MLIASMLARSIISYSIFVVSRKIVRGGIGLGESLRKGLEMHKCFNCYRLYSGEIKECRFCGEDCKPLYRVYEDDEYGPYNNSDEFEKREGLEKQVYNDTRDFKFKSEGKDDRYSRKPGRESGRGYQGRNSNTPRYGNDNRRRSHSNGR